MSNTGSAHLVTPFLTVLALFVALLGWVYGPSVRARLAGAARLVSGQVQGGLLILFVVVLWTSSSVAIQMVFEAKFDKPFFLTYASASLLMVYLPFYPDRLRDLLILARQQLGLRTRGPPDSGIIGHAARGERPTMWRKPTDAPQDDPLSTDECMEIALRLGFIWFMLQLTFNVGLRLSSVSSVTIISASSSLWTLVIGAIRERERPSLGKLFAVLLTFGGVVLVMLAGAKRHQVDTRRMLWGDLAALFSAIAYGLYAVSLRAEVPSEGALPMPLLFGLIGLACFGLTWPLLVILHLMGLEPFSLPPPPAALAIAANALVGTVLANMLLARQPVDTAVFRAAQPLRPARAAAALAPGGSPTLPSSDQATEGDPGGSGAASEAGRSRRFARAPPSGPRDAARLAAPRHRRPLARHPARNALRRRAPSHHALLGAARPGKPRGVGRRPLYEGARPICAARRPPVQGHPVLRSCGLPREVHWWLRAP